jgi:predicted transcriptional regulator
MHEPSKNFTLRVNPVLMRRIEELAAARGSSRAAAIKAAIVEATVPEVPTVFPRPASN